jgi:DNA/RNA endonuclease G (NUC1)
MTRLLLAVVGILLAALPTPAHEICKNSQVPAAELRRYDGAALLLSRDEILEAEARHLPFGYPDREARLLYDKEFVFRYDIERRIPLWASYRLERRDVPEPARNPRRNSFRVDPRLSDDEASFCKDYDEPIFDRGHLVPNSDMQRSKRAQAHSFFLSNMAPQHAWFNQKIWAHFEGMVRKWTRQSGAVHVISGSVFDEDRDRRPDPVNQAKWMRPTERVAVATHFYKIVVRERDGQREAIAVMLPHMKTGPSRKADWERLLAEHIVTIRDVAEVTGLQFFRDLDTSRRRGLEESRPSTLWTTR